MVVFCGTTTRSGVTRSAFDIELPNVAENIHGCFAQQNGIEKFHTLSPLGLIKFPNMGHDFIHLKMTCSTIFSRLDQVIQQDEGLFIYFFTSHVSHQFLFYSSLVLTFLGWDSYNECRVVALDIACLTVCLFKRDQSTRS